MVSFKGLFYPLNIMQCVNVFQSYPKALVKRMQNGKFQRFILSSQHNAMCQRFPRHVLLSQFRNLVCSIMQKGNGKTWIQKCFLTRGLHRFIEEILQGAKGGKFEYF